MAPFDFVVEYRGLQPTAERELITARNASFEAAVAAAKTSIARIVDLAHFAYRLPLSQESESKTWFGEILRSEDSTFSIELDVEEAARIATLVLKSRMNDGSSSTPIIVQSASFAGRRQTVDKHGLSLAARTALADRVRKRGSSVVRPPIAAGEPAAMEDIIAQYEDSADTETTEGVVFEAVVGDYLAQIKAVVASANAAVAGAWNENRRLAEEIDLLWWHLGGHSHLLDRSIAGIPFELRPIVIGMDVGEMISSAPGPFGTYGIIRKALGEDADETFTLGDAVKAASTEFADLMTRPVVRYPIAPIHGALGDAVLGETPVNAALFKRRTGLSLDSKLSGYDMAVQAYHERMLYKLGHI